MFENADLDKLNNSVDDVLKHRKAELVELPVLRQAISG
jgi:hypothetical protein